MVAEVEFWFMSFMNVSLGLFWKIVVCSTAFRSCTISMCNDSNILIQIWVRSFWIWVFREMDWWKSWKTPMKIHGWFKLGTFTFQPPEIGSEWNSHPSICWKSHRGKNRTFGGFLNKPLLPSRGYPESLYSISICDVCQRSPPRCSMIKGKMWVFGEYHPGSLFSENLPRLKSWNITHT